MGTGCTETGLQSKQISVYSRPFKNCISCGQPRGQDGGASSLTQKLELGLYETRIFPYHVGGYKEAFSGFHETPSQRRPIVGVHNLQGVNVDVETKDSAWRDWNHGGYTDK